MEKMVIGRLDESDQEKIDKQMDILYETSEDPFAHEPVRRRQPPVDPEELPRRQVRWWRWGRGARTMTR